LSALGSSGWTDAGIATKISCHSFRATRITTYLQNGGKLEVVQQIPALWHDQKDRRSES
jgi:site-specific recombinase XerD